jgi:hypothetical protein
MNMLHVCVYAERRHGQGHEHVDISMYIYVQHGHTLYMQHGMGMQHGHRHAAYTETCSIDTNMQHRLGHAAWTWTLGYNDFNLLF